MKFKGEGRLVKKTAYYNLHLHAHTGSGFDSWIILKKISCDKHILDIIKNGRGIISLIFFVKIIKIKLNSI